MPELSRLVESGILGLAFFLALIVYRLAQNRLPPLKTQGKDETPDKGVWVCQEHSKVVDGLSSQGNSLEKVVEAHTEALRTLCDSMRSVQTDMSSTKGTVEKTEANTVGIGQQLTKVTTLLEAKVR